MIDDYKSVFKGWEGTILFNGDRVGKVRNISLSISRNMTEINAIGTEFPIMNIPGKVTMTGTLTQALINMFKLRLLSTNLSADDEIEHDYRRAERIKNVSFGQDYNMESIFESGDDMTSKKNEFPETGIKNDISKLYFDIEVELTTRDSDGQTRNLHAKLKNCLLTSTNINIDNNDWVMEDVNFTPLQVIFDESSRRRNRRRN